MFSQCPQDHLGKKSSVFLIHRIQRYLIMDIRISCIRMIIISLFNWNKCTIIMSFIDLLVKILDSNNTHTDLKVDMSIIFLDQEAGKGIQLDQSY